MDQKIKALAPRDDLHENNELFSVYRDHLDEVFDDPKINNLALSGGLGSGKSSIIRSYDRWRNKGRTHFLYTSLIDFSNPKHESTKDEQKHLEHSLLNQILSYCTENELPEGSISGIPERFKWLRSYAFVIAALVFASFILVFHEYFGELARKLETEKLLTFITDDVRKWTHLGLYVFVGIVISCCVFYVFSRCLPFFRLSKLTLKANNAEAEVLIGKERTCLDMYKFELVYALERIGKKYDHTVVFEDLERLTPEIAVDIMDKLRELNTLTNNHIKASTPHHVLMFIQSLVYKRLINLKETWFRRFCAKVYNTCEKRLSRDRIRFVYAISDRTIDAEHRTKFYDCIIPIIPTSNPLNGRAQLEKMLKDLSVEQIWRNKLCTALSDAVVDYRTRLTLRNEFLVLWNLYLRGNTQPQTDNEEILAINKATMFAIAAYKVLLPECFEQTLSPEGTGILPKVDTSDLQNLPDRLRGLTAVQRLYTEDLLHDDCLRLIIGEQELMEHWLNILHSVFLDELIDNIPEPTKTVVIGVIRAVEKVKEKIAGQSYWVRFRKQMTTVLHTMHEKYEQERFNLAADSLAAVSRPNVPEDWEWLVNDIPGELSSSMCRIYFSRCINYLSNNTQVLNDNKKLLSKWVFNLVNFLAGDDLSYGATPWTDEMYNSVRNIMQGSSLRIQESHAETTTICGKKLRHIIE